MKAADRKAIKTVQNAATSRFAQHIFYLQNSDRKRWDHLWRSVRLSCPECEGYLRRNFARPGPHNHPMAACVECDNDALSAPDFWKAKAQVVSHLFAGDAYPILWPYIMVEPKPKRVEAAEAVAQG